MVLFFDTLNAGKWSWGPTWGDQEATKMGDTKMHDLTHKYGIAMLGGLLILAFIIAVYA